MQHEHRKPTRGVSPERKAGYYLGNALVFLGFALCASPVLLAFLGVGLGDGNGMPSFFPLFAIGFVLFIAGGILRSIGARGLAGSGVVLDPEGARRDLEPYSRMVGGLAADALDESGIAPGVRTVEVVKIRCRACGKLNEDDSKFCQECGQPI